MKFAPLLLSLLFAAITVSAQVNPQCPNILVTGPDGVIRPGDLIPFTVTVKPIESKIAYQWTVNSGTITEGQGTQTIKVSLRPDASSVTAAVEIIGLPDDCSKTASETISDLNGSVPKAKKLDTFLLPLSSVSDQRFQSIANAISNDPTTQTFIFVPAKTEVRDALVARLDKVIGHPFDLPRITFVETNADNKFIEIWLVPPGASEPTCAKCDPRKTPEKVRNLPSVPRSPIKSSAALKRPLQCPYITIIGPSRVAMPGDVIVFRSSLSRRVPRSTKYIWSVSYGKIVSGQSTRSMKVRIPIGAGSAISASLTLSGLPQVCENFNSATIVAGIAPQPLVDPYARYGDISLETEKEKLRNAFTVLAKYPRFKLLVVKRSPTNACAMNKRIADIDSFIYNELKVSRNRYRLVTIGGNDIETEIWFVKTGTNVASLVGSNRISSKTGFRGHRGSLSFVG